MARAKAARRPVPLWNIVEESLDEATFLWRRWEDALATHSRDLNSVSFWIERRLLGAIDGVQAGGDAGIESLLVPALSADDGFCVTAAGYALAKEADAGGLDALVAFARNADESKLAALVRAIELAESEAVIGRFEDAWADARPALTAALLNIQTFQRRRPGARIVAALGGDDPGLRVAGLRALRHAAPAFASREIARGLEDPDPAALDAAMETGLILGVPAAWQCCLDRAAARSPGSGGALLLCAMLGNERAQARVLAAASDETLGRAAIFALGFAGTHAAAEMCLQAMSQEPLARLAVEAFCAITGLDLETERLVASPEAEVAEPIPFEEEDLEADLVPSPEDLLPLPDVAGVQRWWSARSDRFVSGRRYLGGRTVDLESLQEALVGGRTRRRHATALELAIRTGGRYQVETRAFTAEQRRQMQSFDRLGGAAIPPSPLARSFSRA